MTTPTIIGQILLLSSLCVLGLIFHRVSKLDITLSALLAGIIGGISIPLFGIDTGIRASNIHDLVFYVILPILIFEAAWHIRPALLKRWLAPIMLLATVGVLMGCAVVAVIVFYGIGYAASFPWIAALITGAILAATDPIAVVASLKKLKAPEDLATLIEGESLFNDATAVVLFTVILSFATASAESDTGYTMLFFSVFFGGIMVGAVAGLIAAILALLLANRSSANIVLILLAFSSFYMAEHFFHVSGIMAVMSAAIVSKSLLQEHEDLVLKDIAPTWHWLGLYFNTLIFSLMGLVISFEMFKDQWLAMIIAIVAALLARALAVFSIGATTRFNTRPIPIGWQIVMFWGGLRGAIAVVLVLSLPTSLPYWWTIQSMVFGVVLFTLLIQGTTSGWLIKKYGQSHF